jgi:cob(I)alamin adenosyltransferase
MVVLSRIYTRTGDRGTTALGDGKRVAKDHPRVEAVGAVDELNAVLGLALAAGLDPGAAELLRAAQNDLFDLGADLCLPERSRRARAGRAARRPLRVTAAQVARLERAIDRFNAPLGTLRSFVLPGGTTASSWLHLARTVCRRAERRLVTLGRAARLNPQALVYLNRLSDLLFVLARRANDGGRADVLWVPGGASEGGGPAPEAGGPGPAPDR